MSARGLSDKVVVVTGAAQGIGAAYARRLVADGATVVLADRDGEGARVAAAGLGGPGGSRAFGFDVADPQGCAALAGFVAEEHGRVDGLVNNAAVFSSITMKPFWEITVAEWDALMAVNLRGPWLLVTALLPLLRRSAGASVHGMTFSTSRELGELGIRVNTLSPGPTDTEVPRELPSCSRTTARSSPDRPSASTGAWCTASAVPTPGRLPRGERA